MKLQLLTEGGDACSLQKRSERSMFQKYYADEDSVDDSSKNGGGGGSYYDTAVSKALSTRGSPGQMKFHMRQARRHISITT